jgi:mycothiol system anti-sigma-R factor
MTSAAGREDDCLEAVHKLYHFLDGELTDEKRKQIQEHLDNCSPCGQAYDFEKELRKVISEKCREQVPESLKEKIAAAINHERLRGE